MDCSITSYWSVVNVFSSFASVWSVKNLFLFVNHNLSSLSFFYSGNVFAWFYSTFFCREFIFSLFCSNNNCVSTFRQSLFPKKWIRKHTCCLVTCLMTFILLQLSPIYYTSKTIGNFQSLAVCSSISGSNCASLQTFRGIFILRVYFLFQNTSFFGDFVKEM